MTTRSSVRPLDAEALLAESGWVRALVRQLIADEAQVDDVVQDTWVAALQRPPALDQRGGLRAWLATVARNLSRRARRREAGRAHVEHAAARHEALPSAAEDLARLQLHKLLVEAAIELPEPYRSAATARYFAELSYGEIARRQGCTPVAARQRVSRGLALLRARLDREFRGERASWCVALGAAFALSRAARPGLGPIVAGGIAMSVKSVLVAVVAAAGVAVTAVLWMQPEADVVASPRTAEERAEPAASPPRAEVAAADVSEPAATDERREALAPTAARDVADVLAGLITDTAAVPLTEVHARLFDRGAQPGASPRAEAASDEHGRFELSLPPGALREQLELEIAHDGYVCERVTKLDQTLVVALARLPQLGGRVIAPAGKHPAPPWELRAVVRPPNAGPEITRDAEIAADGTYTVADLPLGTLIKLDARVRGFARVELAPDLALQPDGVVSFDFELPLGSVIEGVVLDSATRAPIAGAKVWTDEYMLFNPDAPIPLAYTDELGRFRVEGSTFSYSGGSHDERVAYTLYGAEAAGYAPPEDRFLVCRPDATGVSHIEILLEPSACRFSGIVFMPDGVDPAGGSQIMVIDARDNLRFASSADDGTFTLEDLAPGTLTVSVRRGADPGRPRLALHATIELAPARRTVDRLVLSEGEAAIAGRVLDLGGAPLAGVNVDIAWRVEGSGMSLVSTYDNTDTDRDGRYRFDGLPAGKYVMSVDGDSSRTPCSRPNPIELELEPKEHRGNVDFVAGECLTVRGQVELGARSADNLEVSLRRISDSETLTQVSVAEDGTFQLDPVIADDYDVVLTDEGVELDRASARADVEIVLRAQPR